MKNVLNNYENCRKIWDSPQAYSDLHACSFMWIWKQKKYVVYKKHTRVFSSCNAGSKKVLLGG